MSSAVEWAPIPDDGLPALRRSARDRLTYLSAKSLIGYPSAIAVHQQLAWYVGGPVLGLCVVALRWLLNERLGATGAWSNAVERVTSPGTRLDTRGWLLIGLVLGGIVFGIFGAGLDGYGWLTETFTGDARWVIVPVLLVAGALIGFGAKTAGGCTSGNGLSRQRGPLPASLVATATFFGTAIAVSFLIEALT